MSIERTAELEEALAEVCAAAAVQLSGMGKGVKPSQRLQEAFAKANVLLGREPSFDPSDRDQSLKDEIERLRAELSKRP
jgi:hypothetical protein